MHKVHVSALNDKCPRENSGVDCMELCVFLLIIDDLLAIFHSNLPKTYTVMQFISDKCIQLPKNIFFEKI